ncbi:unnamed protein product [Plutella xylostella]|uniref:Ribonuclease P/MRP protein subunit POP5 n=1 Tax=Plutella xylostella TaxID=51655 RepID=A0A8S4EGR6_PLUXY|nr:unnamed protein product [Plutella xylostella]
MIVYYFRYLTVAISSPSVPNEKPLGLRSGVFHEAVLDKIQQLHGDFGVAAVRSGFLAKYCNENTRIGILRARHGPHRFVSTSLPFITKIGKLDVTLQTLHVGATLKHSFKFIQKYQRSYLDSMWHSLKTDEEKRKLELAVMDFTKTDVTLNLEKMT